MHRGRSETRRVVRKRAIRTLDTLDGIRVYRTRRVTENTKIATGASCQNNHANRVCPTLILTGMREGCNVKMVGVGKRVYRAIGKSNGPRVYRTLRIK